MIVDFVLFTYPPGLTGEQILEHARPPQMGNWHSHMEKLLFFATIRRLMRVILDIAAKPQRGGKRGYRIDHRH